MRQLLGQLGVITDADNTLWDTDRIYAESQLWLLSAVEAKAQASCRQADRLSYIREVDQAIAKRHHQGLRYPSVLLVIALNKSLQGVNSARAANDVVHSPDHSPDEQAIADQFDEMLKRTPPLRPGVKQGVAAIKELRIPILVATEGSVDRCRARLSHWELLHSVDHVLSAPKSREFFERASRLLKIPTDRCLVVGDQVDRDILFAGSAGCITVYFAGGFSPSWSPKVADARPDYVVDAFDKVVPIIKDRLNQLGIQTS